MDPPASVANKRLTAGPTPLDATLTKNSGVRDLFFASTAMPPLSFHTLTNCSFHNSFVLTFMQIGGGVYPLFISTFKHSTLPEPLGYM
jgi:hypothetical protein